MCAVAHEGGTKTGGCGRRARIPAVRAIQLAPLLVPLRAHVQSPSAQCPDCTFPAGVPALPNLHCSPADILLLVDDNAAQREGTALPELSTLSSSFCSSDWVLSAMSSITSLPNEQQAGPSRTPTRKLRRIESLGVEVLGNVSPANVQMERINSERILTTVKLADGRVTLCHIAVFSIEIQPNR